jgi:uncharacterized lipoprotein YddW (UPF0748 family)
MRLLAGMTAILAVDVAAFGHAAGAEPVLLVRNTASAEQPSERALASRITDRLGKWLSSAGIEYGVITDEEVARGALRGARLAVLAYHPHPPPRVVSALRRFARDGGKMLVCYSASAELAELMGVRLGPYRRAAEPGEWTSFVFTDPAEWNVPARVHQDSTSIMPAYPAGASARVIAWWENDRGERTRDPAWLASDRGLWMTHVLLGDDAPSKTRMLLGLVGACEPGAWITAARHALEEAGRVDSFASFSRAREAIRAAAPRAAEPRAVERLLARGERLREEMIALYQERRHADTVNRGDELRAVLTEAFARIQQPRAGEFRGIWDHEGTGWFPGNWNATCRILAANGFNAVFPNVLWGGLAHYPSRVLPTSSTLARYGDQLAQCVQAAHRHDLQVHAWKVCWSLGNAPKDFAARLRKEGRLQMDASGRVTPSLCPSHPDNIALEIEALREVARGYEVDGIHLDYVRFANPGYCYCRQCRATFEKSRGGKAAGWPASCRPGGRLWRAYRDWRVAQIRQFVRRAGAAVRGERPGIRVSAAVWGNYPGCADSVGQDWAQWVRDGAVDFVCPMNYTADSKRFAEWTRGQVALPGLRGRVYPGIGVTAAESQLRPDQAVEQVLAARRLGAAGFMVFDMSHTVRRETIPLFRMGLTAPSP